MRFTSAAVILASLVANIHARFMPNEAGGIFEPEQQQHFIGMFGLAPDQSCNKIDEGVVATAQHSHGLLDKNMHSIKVYVSNCKSMSNR